MSQSYKHKESTEERKITLFVDIDGVLNTEAHLRRQAAETGTYSNKKWCPVAMAHLKLLVEYYNGQIVVSSTWRYDHSLDELKALFEQNGLPPEYVVDVTPALFYDTAEKVNRGEEIRRWIRDNLDLNQVPQYFILDDLDDGLSTFGDRFIHCDPKIGFADKEKVKKIAGLV